MNLEAFQKRVSGIHGEDLSISVLYLPQLMGVALGLPSEALQLNLNLAFTPALQARLP
jgi:heterodisulfide reductase subunit B